MILLGNALVALAQILDAAFTVYFWIVIASVVVSWVGADPWNPIVRFLRSATDPVYAKIRRLLPFVAVGGIDFSPMVLVFGIMFLQRAIVPTLVAYGYRLAAS